MWAAQSKFKDEIPDTNVFVWVDVRDVAVAHVAAMERAEAANKRFFVITGHFCNRELCQIIKKNFPQYKGLPGDDTPGGDFPGGSVNNLFKVDNSRSVQVLGMKYRSLEEAVVDAIKSFQAAGLPAQ